ncbi:MAG: hypothetical protein AAF560_16945 [Acidobacteriota bacterium]
MIARSFIRHTTRGLILAALWAPQAVMAQTAATPNLHPNLVRGQGEDGRYDTDDAVAVDLFNGNLMMDVALGQTYPIDARLQYQAKLHYNSHIWDFAADGTGSPVALSNAGLGFDLSFGRLLPPSTGINGTSQWAYVEPDGRTRLFFSDLHWDTADPSDPGDAFRYTRDGSYLRLHLISPGLARVEFPNGTFREMVPMAGEWRTQRIAALDGANQLLITYAPDDLTWTLDDSHGRTQVVRFVADPARAGGRLVSSVELSAFGGTRATYQLSYQQIVVPRACSDPRGGTETVSVLTSLTDPVGFVRTYTYYDVADGCLDGGRLRTAQNVHGGIIELDYDAYTFPNQTCEQASPVPLTEVSGVVQRRHLHPLGQVIGTWTYQPSHVLAGCAADERRTAVVTPRGDRIIHYFGAGGDGASVGESADYALPVSDLEVDTANSTAAVRMALATRIWDCDETGGSCQLQRSIWEGWNQDERCADASGNCFATNRRLEMRRTVFHDDEDRFRHIVHSHFDGLGTYRTMTKTSDFGAADLQTKTRWANPEAGSYPLILGKTGVASFVVPATSAPWLLTDASYEKVTDDQGSSLRRDLCYDAFGQKVRERKRSSALSADDLLTVRTWQGGQPIASALYGGATQELATTSLCTLQLPAQPVYEMEQTWQYGARASMRWLEPDGTPMAHYVEDRDIDLDTALISSQRDVSGLATDHVYDARGRLTWRRPEADGGAWLEIRYREPQSNLGGGWAGPQRTFYSRPNGVGSGTLIGRRVEQNDVFGRRFLDQAWTDGTNAVRQVYEYDAQDRLVAESTSHHLGESYNWHRWLDLDPFDRPRLERPADGTAHDVTYEYFGDRLARKTESSRRAFDTVIETCYEHPAVTETTRDGQGREWKTRFERSLPSPGQTIETERHYQPDDKLRLEENRRTVGANTRIDRRELDFNGLGQLTAQRSYSGSAPTPRLLETVTYSEHDAMGRVRHKLQVGDRYPLPGTATQLNFDAAGRLTSVEDALVPGRLWKELHYAEANSGGTSGEALDRSLGKLVRAVRHNYSSSLYAAGAHHTVEETYAYRGVGGRRSQMTASLATVYSSSVELQLARSFETSVAYDELGRVVTVVYPQCVQCADGEPTEERQVTYSHDWLGRVTSVEGALGTETQDWADSITWHAAGIPQEIVHDNSVRDIFTIDPSGLARPARVQVEWGATTHYDSGTMSYDGRGELCGHGDRALAGAPDEISNPQDEPLPGCLASMLRDPFGAWNGEYSDNDCILDDGPAPLLVFDPWDRPFGTIDLSARRSVNTGNGVELIRDPELYHHAWTLYGVEGRMLRSVKNHYQGDWWETVDRVFGAGLELGQARLDVYAPGYTDRAHFHRMMTEHTNWRGWARTPWF